MSSYTDGMKYILKFYGDMRMKKTEDSTLRACFKEIARIEREI